MGGSHHFQAPLGLLSDPASDRARHLTSPPTATQKFYGEMGTATQLATNRHPLGCSATLSSDRVRHLTYTADLALGGGLHQDRDVALDARDLGVHADPQEVVEAALLRDLLVQRVP